MNNSDICITHANIEIKVMNEKHINHGDIFAIPLPDGSYLFGRVMLDIYATTKRRLFPADSPLSGLGKALLIEVYEQVSESLDYKPSDLLIPGAIVEADELGHTWPILTNSDIDVHDVQFPEAMIGHMHNAGEVAFLCGEIRLLLPFKQRELMTMRVLLTRHSAFLWPYVCLHELGRASEIPDKYRKGCHLRTSDLRYTEHRSKVYQHLPLDPDDSYYEQQKQLGLNLERLYE
jgi:hypothetical protein